MANGWQEYQEEVAAFFRSLGLEATTNFRAQGVRTVHDIDVYVKSHHVGFDITWIVECKYWNKPVSKLHVLALRTIVSELGVDRGIILCEAGFQTGAVEAANLTNVHAKSLAELRGTASIDFAAMRLRELYDRVDACRTRYWELPKDARIKAGLRPGFGGDENFYGDHVITLASDLLGRAMRGAYPVSLDTLPAIVILGDGHRFESESEIRSWVEESLDKLELRLAACEASLK